MRTTGLMLLALLVLAVLSGCPTRPAATPPPAVPPQPSTPAPTLKLPTYLCPRAAGPIKIDGVLGEPSWAKAPVIGPFTLWDGKPAAHSTKARMLWSKWNLYVGFVCGDPDLQGAMRKRDQNLWEQNEVVEIFIDPAGDGQCYLEFEVNPLNTVVDLVLPKAGAPGPLAGKKCFDAHGMKTAVKVRGTVGNAKDKDKGWTVEMAIPLADFLTAPNCPPKDGDVWRVNLYRIDSSSGKVEYQAWSPTNTEKPDFHVPDHFGKLQFAAPPAPARKPTAATPPAGGKAPAPAGAATKGPAVTVPPAAPPPAGEGGAGSSAPKPAPAAGETKQPPGAAATKQPPAAQPAAPSSKR